MPRIEQDPPLLWRARFSEALLRLQFVIYTTIIFALFAIGWLWHRMFIIVPPGHLGVMYRTLAEGTVTNRVWGEGLHVIPPWDHLRAYEVRLQQETLEFKVLSDEGLALGVQAVVRFRPNEDMLGYLQQDVGPDYFKRLIRPEIEAHIRRTFGSRPAHELYATVRDVMQELGQFPLIGRLEMKTAATATQPYVFIQDVKLVAIDLPKIVENAIANKYEQEQLMLAYKYKLERESQEADRKRTEAAGIRDFNQIVGKNLDIVRWRSLEVASEFARSSNSKVVMLGGGQGGALPMILNLGDAPSGLSSPATPEQKPEPEKPITKAAGSQQGVTPTLPPRPAPQPAPLQTPAKPRLP